MIDELARLLAECDGCPCFDQDATGAYNRQVYRRNAGRFLRRLREPTPEMVAAGATFLDATGRHHSWWPKSIPKYTQTDDTIAIDEFEAIVEGITRAMIDAAIGDAK